jgi:formylmethanofuran dehydrogenase subunit E
MNTPPHVRYLAALLSVLIPAGVAVTARSSPRPGAQVGFEDSFLHAWVKTAEYNRPLWVLDTDSALGRRNLRPKRLMLRDVALVHGHLCDGLVVAWVELGAALRELFPEGVVDRTDLRAVARNGPCWVDAAAWTTGARINHGTLMLDNSVGDAFIVERVSTGAAVRVALRPAVLPADLAELDRSIRDRGASGQTVLPEEVDRFEALADRFSRMLLETPPEHVVRIETLREFRFPATSRNPVAPRSDVVNRELPRKGRAEAGLCARVPGFPLG